MRTSNNTAREARRSNRYRLLPKHLRAQAVKPSDRLAIGVNEYIKAESLSHQYDLAILPCGSGFPAAIRIMANSGNSGRHWTDFLKAEEGFSLQPPSSFLVGRWRRDWGRRDVR